MAPLIGRRAEGGRKFKRERRQTLSGHFLVVFRKMTAHSSIYEEEGAI